MTKRRYALVCKSCGSTFDSDTIQECTKCGGLIGVDFDLSTVEISRSNLDAREKMWQFSDLLPLQPGDEPVSLGEGGTPLVFSQKRYGNGSVGFKVDYLNPTCSFKDRGASLLLTKARATKAKMIAIDSSGNAAAAASAYAAKAGIGAHVFVPESTSPDKLRQIGAYGASLVRVAGTREDVLKKARSFASETGSYYCGFQFNPFASEATKTLAYEVGQQMDWQAPNYLISPIGTGGLLIGSAQGFFDLASLGWIDQVPKIIGVQGESCSPVVKSFQEKTKIEPVREPHTVAEGLKIGNPYKGEVAVEQITRSGGSAMSVNDSEILKAKDRLAKEEGLFVEPSGAVSFAGFLKLSENDFFSHGDRVVCILTGSGLKSSVY